VIGPSTGKVGGFSKVACPKLDSFSSRRTTAGKKKLRPSFPLQQPRNEQKGISEQGREGVKDREHSLWLLQWLHDTNFGWPRVEAQDQG